MLRNPVHDKTCGGIFLDLRSAAQGSAAAPLNHLFHSALFEYSFQVPANRIGFDGNGGPFSLLELKVIQEVITLTVFTLFSMLLFGLKLQWNHLAAFFCLVMAVWFTFQKP